jgi:hypothetical protein
MLDEYFCKTDEKKLLIGRFSVGGEMKCREETTSALNLNH